MGCSDMALHLTPAIVTVAQIYVTSARLHSHSFKSKSDPAQCALDLARPYIRSIPAQTFLGSNGLTDSLRKLGKLPKYSSAALFQGKVEVGLSVRCHFHG